MSLSFSSRVIIAPDVLCRGMGDESVLLNLKTQVYLGLDAVGTRMWTVLKDSSSVQEAYESLLAEYDATAECLRRDLLEFLDQLRSQGLIQLVTGKSTAS